MVVKGNDYRGSAPQDLGGPARGQFKPLFQDLEGAGPLRPQGACLRLTALMSGLS